VGQAKKPVAECWRGRWVPGCRRCADGARNARLDSSLLIRIGIYIDNISFDSRLCLLLHFPRNILHHLWIKTVKDVKNMIMEVRNEFEEYQLAL
jgi:hypothetical protein